MFAFCDLGRAVSGLWAFGSAKFVGFRAPALRIRAFVLFGVRRLGCSKLVEGLVRIVLHVGKEKKQRINGKLLKSKTCKS